MSVKVVAELHPFRRTRVKITTGPKAIAEIIKDLNTGFPLSQARVCRNGEIVKDFSLTANDGDTLAVKFVPYGSTGEVGAGMKIAGWALVGLGALSFLIPGVGGFFGSALIGTGLSMALGGTVLLNINVPSLKDREKPEQDPSIRGGKNQMRQSGRIPVLFGRHRVYLDLAANPHTQIIDGKQYYTQLFCGGYKDCVIDINSFKLGETYLKDLSQTKNINSILSGADPVVRMEVLQNGEASGVYPHCVHEDAVNAPLQNRIDDVNGNKISGELIRSTPDNTDAINVDIFFYNGLGKYDDKGKVASASVEVRAWYKPFDAPDSRYALLGYFNNGSNSVSGSELKTKRCQITKSGLPVGKYTVKIERVTPDSTDSKIIDQVYVGSVRSIKSTRPIRAERQKNLTVIALRVLATSQMNGMLDSFNYVATAKTPVYSGGGSGALYWLNSAETRNPASALLYALRGRAAQQTVDDGDINWPSLEAFYVWCEEHEYECNAYLSESVTIAELMRMIGGTARADILRIDSKISVVQDIERPTHMQLFTPKNTISYSVTMFSADVPDAISLRFIDEGAGYAQNEAEVFNTPDGNRANEPDTIQKADLWGVTNSKQARRIGMYNYACLKNRPFVHVIEADIEYLICNKGDWIQYAGDIALAGSAQGRIKGIILVDGVCVGVDTDEPMAMTGGKQHAIRIRLSNGTIILKDVVLNTGERHEKSIAYYPSDGEDPYEPPVGDLCAVDEDNVYYDPPNAVLFTEPLEKSDAPKAGDIYAFGVRGYEVLDLIITDVQPGQNFTAVLTCVEYAPEIFGVDREGFILPDFVNRITPVSGAVDSGVVNPDRWRSFATYHDGEDEPDRPSSDGQGEGWHHLQTYRSVWLSTKVAESVDAGEWGLPVRIRAERGGDDVTPVWLSLSPQNITLDTDGDGNLLAELLPLTVQARLFKWNSLLTDVSFSLAYAPSGVSVDSNGVITVDANAALDEANNITVRAEYQGGTYTAALLINKKINHSAPRYLGTVDELSAVATITIIKGPVPGQVRAWQGDYVLAVAAAGGRLAGSVFQWTGVVWEYRAPENYSDLYIRCFSDGLEVPELAQDMGWFGAAFAKLLVAQQAFITYLFSRSITLLHPGFLKSENFEEEDTTKKGEGFNILSNGEMEIYNAKKIVLSEPGPVEKGKKRVYIDRDELVIEEYMGNNVWKKLAGLVLAAGLGALSCKVETSSDFSSVSLFDPVTDAITAIAFGNGRFVALGGFSSSFKAAISSNGITWNIVNNLSLLTPASITYGNNKFVAVGNSGKMAVSADGTTWTAVANSTFGTDLIIGIAYGNNKFVAVGDSGKMAVSADGTTWTAVANSTFGTYAITAIVYGNGIFLAAGGRGAATLAYSSDGFTWKILGEFVFGYHNSGLANSVESIAYGNSKFVVGGMGGKIGCWSGSELTLNTRFGFTDKHIASNKIRLKLSDGNWLDLNNNGTVTWSNI